MSSAEAVRPVPSDSRERERILRATGRSILVEAAAGTGKTTLIVDRILRCVLDGSIRLSRTAAITFSESAAAELQERIRAALERAISDGAASAQGRERLRQAYSELDHAETCTIHSFCARLLREKPAEAGVDPEFDVLDETASHILRGAAWQDWLGRQVAESAPALVEALRAGLRTSQLRQLADELCKAPETFESDGFSLPAPAPDPGALAERFRSLAGPLSRLMAAEMRRGNDDSRRLRSIAERVARLRPEARNEVRRHAYDAAGIDVEKALRSFPPARRDELRAAVDEFLQPARALASHLAAEVLRWLGGFLEHYREAKRARSVLDFQDLLLLAAGMLRRNLGVRRYFQRQFDALFVDELQDTDPLQMEVVAYLCERQDSRPAGAMEQVRLADGKLFGVGDPKQSIYRFRRADVQVYERLKGLLGPERVARVWCNFRSGPRLLGWFNRAFERLFEPPELEGVYQARHVPLRPPEGAVEEQWPPVLALCPPPGLMKDGPRAPEARRREAHYLALAIRAAVDGELGPSGMGGVSHGSTALLFRAMTDAAIYEAALEAHGIPYCTVGGKHFYQREHVVETLALLRAIEDPLDEPAVVAALRSSFFGISDEDLFRYREGGGQWNYLVTRLRSGPVGRAMERLAAWHGMRNRVAPDELLQGVFAETGAMQTFLLKPGGRQRVANVQKLLGQLRGIAAAAGTFGAVVRYLSSVQQERLPEAEPSALEPGDEFVRLMSAHKAKGLQFDLVVLPDLSRPVRRESGAPSLLLDRLNGTVGVRLRAGLASDGFDEMAARERANALAEERRLLYVACTRARKALLLPLYWHARAAQQDSFEGMLLATGCFVGPEEVPYGQERDGVFYVDTRPWAGERARRIPARPVPAAGEAEEVDRLLGERDAWMQRREALTRASGGARIVLPSAVEGEPRQRQEAATDRGSGGREFGSLFHALMARAPLERPGPGAHGLLRGLAAVEAAELGAGQDQVGLACELALKALCEPEFRALLDGASLVAREVRFCVPLGSLPVCSRSAPGFVEGSVDLLVHAGRTTTILDYKTDRVSPGGEEAAAAGYWPQLALYAMAARAAGRVGERLWLALFFVRTGHILRREFGQGMAEMVRQLLDAAPEERDG